MRPLRKIWIGVALALPLLAAHLASAQGHPCDRRDEGLTLIGWVAGNSYDSYLWPQVRQYAGVTGHDYLSLASAGCSGGDQEAEAKASYRLYQKAFASGRADPFDQAESLSRLRQAQDITQELRQMNR
ncbi:hypothetical protein [Limibacillus sp. MBR-115]|jgi:hypothetical protein|uniref:hypothetical protein n=1 Tax=Limibacillus sp. MBR-115 TaxID=3156465 RepID=UPI003391F2FC